MFEILELVMTLFGRLQRVRFPNCNDVLMKLANSANAANSYILLCRVTGLVRFFQIAGQICSLAALILVIRHFPHVEASDHTLYWGMSLWVRPENNVLAATPIALCRWVLILCVLGFVSSIAAAVLLANYSRQLEQLCTPQSNIAVHPGAAGQDVAHAQAAS